MKPYKKVFVFALVLFSFVTFARAQATVITNGTFTISGAFPPNSTSATWNIGGDRLITLLTSTNAQVISPVIKRAGAGVEPFTLTHTPHISARGNVASNGFSWGGIFYNSDNHSTKTTFNFNFAAHSLPKFTPSQNDLFIDVPFTMDGNVAVFSSPAATSTLFSRAVSGRGTARINYIRVPNNVRARRLPNPDVWLGYVLFIFHTANGND